MLNFAPFNVFLSTAVTMFVTIHFGRASTCSIELSRQARAVVDEVFLPVVTHHGYQLPRQCPLHPDNDKMAFFAKSSKYLRRKRWQCEICEKIFSNQQYLDQHFENQHGDLIPKNSTVCLGDWCDIFGCTSLEDENDVPLPCNELAMKRRNLECQQLMQLCFPVTSPDPSGKLHEFFSRQYCDQLSCTGNLVRLSPDQLAKFSGRWTWRSALYGFLALCILLGLILFYTGLLVHTKERRLHNDLRRLSSERQTMRLLFMQPTAKIKGY